MLFSPEWAHNEMTTRTTMRAAVLAAPGQFRLETVPMPEPAEGQVRVRLEGCGVCGSNLAPWEGRPWFNYPFAPGAPGHEGWGIVDAVGSSVESVHPGERVAFLSYHAFAEYDLAGADALVKLPAWLEKRPFPGEALGCAMNVFRRADIGSRQTVAVVGIGFLGAVLTALAAKAGARVIAISRRPFALDIAKACGAEEVISSTEPSRVIERIKTLTGDRGCERVIEAVGLQSALDLAGELTCERGRLVIAGYHQDGPRQINLQLWNWRGLDVINAHERDSRVYVRGMQEAVEAAATGRLDASCLFTHRFSFDRIGEAFAAMQSRPDRFLKALITL
jgi:threonine dehydrogenase-like Zn-dependent dehydrogenase